MEVWASLGSQSAGAHELHLIQEALKKNFGRGGIDSPASVARTLADASVPLRHPEILAADSAWREAQAHELFGAGELDFRTLEAALGSINRVEELRTQFEAENDESGLISLVDHVRELKKDLPRNGETEREVAQWLTVWLQNPQIFCDWLSLRQQSPEFLEKFGASEKTS